MSGVRRGSQPSANLETVHVRHSHIEQNDVASALLADGDRIGPVGRRQDLEIFEAQSRLEQFAVGPDVVNDQHASCHSVDPGPRKWSIVSKNLATDIGLDRYASQPPCRIFSSSPFIANAVTAMTGIALSSSSSFSHCVTSRPETSGS